MEDLVFATGVYHKPIAQKLRDETDSEAGSVILAQGVARGQGKTQGYHERRIPVTAQMDSEASAARAVRRVKAIAAMQSLLWSALATLFEQGRPVERFSDRVKDQASRYSKVFEQAEDVRFFADLAAETAADQPDMLYLAWLDTLAQRAEAVLRRSFVDGPQSVAQRYRARAMALARFHGALRSTKSPLPELRDYYRDRLSVSGDADADAVVAANASSNETMP